jgi:hypothetical protein
MRWLYLSGTELVAQQLERQSELVLLVLLVPGG